MFLRKIVCGMVWAVLPLVALADPIPAANRAYVGHWSGPGMTLVIHQDGGIQYSRVVDGKAVNFLGDLVSIRGQDFEVQTDTKRVTIKFEKNPVENDGVLATVVDGVRVERR